VQQAGSVEPGAENSGEWGNRGATSEDGSETVGTAGLSRRAVCPPVGGGAGRFAGRVWCAGVGEGDKGRWSGECPQAE